MIERLTQVFLLLDGSYINMGTLKGKVVLINFWATTCTTCVKEMTEIVATYKKFQGKGFETVAGAMQYDPVNWVVNFTKSRQLPFKVALDNTGENAKQWGDIKITPTTFIVDKQGAIEKSTSEHPTSLHSILYRKSVGWEMRAISHRSVIDYSIYVLTFTPTMTTVKSESIANNKYLVEHLLNRARITSIDQVEQHWHLLEAAHIVGQTRFGTHLKVHLAMLNLAWKSKDFLELTGQLLRIALVPLGHLIGRLPIGNPGRANVSAFEPMQPSTKILQTIAESRQALWGLKVK